MFILIPLIIIFLSSSYLYVNEDLSVFTQIFHYILMISISIVSIVLYKNIKKNMEQQEYNKIKLEIFELEKKLQNSTDEKDKNSIKNKIELRKKELI